MGRPLPARCAGRNVDAGGTGQSSRSWGLVCTVLLAQVHQLGFECNQHGCRTGGCCLAEGNGQLGRVKEKQKVPMDYVGSLRFKFCFPSNLSSRAGDGGLVLLSLSRHLCRKELKAFLYTRTDAQAEGLGLWNRTDGTKDLQEELRCMLLLCLHKYAV